MDYGHPARDLLIPVLVSAWHGFTTGAMFIKGTPKQSFHSASCVPIWSLCIIPKSGGQTLGRSISDLLLSPGKQD